jgi:tetratricopeptide (TPR) repeat protein
MTVRPTRNWTGPAIQIAAAGLGAAVAGPLGRALGSWLGGELVGPWGGDIFERCAKKFGDKFKRCAEQFGDKATEKLLDIGADSVVESLKTPPPQLEAVYREALRLSIADIRSQICNDNFGDWFANWDCCLTGSAPLDLSAIRLDEIVPEKLGDLFYRTMEGLDRQGATLRRNDLSIIGGFRIMPNLLLSELKARLPARLQVNFRTLIVEPEYERAWKQAQLVFQDSFGSTLVQVAEDTAAIRRLLEQSFKSALAEGRVTHQQVQDKDAEIARLTEELHKLQHQLAIRASEPVEAELSRLLSLGDLAGALHLKNQQIDARRSEADKLPQDLFELGKIHELRFDWTNALKAYREAWRLKQNQKYGFSYAYCAQKQNQFSEAIHVYRILRSMSTDAIDVVTTLNNLGILYRDTGRVKEAEEAYQEALSILGPLDETSIDNFPIGAMMLSNLGNLYRETLRMDDAEAAFCQAHPIFRVLAETGSAAYLPELAETLNNVALVYRETHRMKRAETAFSEALSIFRKLAEAESEAYLPSIATTLNNLGVLYSDTERMNEAEAAYQEAVSICRKLAKVNPEAHNPDLARSLNNLGVFYRDTQQMKAAEEAKREALSILRMLAEANPEAYAVEQTATVYNLACLYHDMQRMNEAEALFQQALAAYRVLAKANPSAHLPNVATALNDLGTLYSNIDRMKEAEAPHKEALSIWRELAIENPEAFLPEVAVTLKNLAVLYSDTQRMEKAWDYCREAESVLEPLWHTDPKLHGDEMSRILCTHALLCLQSGNSREEACAFARRALAAAHQPDAKQSVDTLVGRICGS